GYLPFFLSKQDLDNAMESTGKEQAAFDSQLTKVHVASLETALQLMQESKQGSPWQDVVFIPSATSRRMLLDLVTSAVYNEENMQYYQEPSVNSKRW
ncbi:hypothetical protein CYMTET_15943, partial [Cymbomonas tetramitiformis]